MTVQTNTEIFRRVHSYLLQQLLPGVAAEELTAETPLIESGVLDSMTILALRAWLEEEFDIELASHELDFEAFGTLGSITGLVARKLTA